MSIAASGYHGLMWFNSWSDLIRVMLVGVVAYATLVIVLRVSGKRTLSKLNAFDLAVTVALGSALATVLLSSDVSWAEGALAFAVLVALQLIVSWSSSRVPRLRGIATAGPTLVLCEGVPIDTALRAQRLALAELQQAVRSTGVGGFDLVAAVVMEGDGTLSVVPHSEQGDGKALRGIPGWPDGPKPLLNELLALENAGWRSLCDGTGADFYGRLMMQDARMVLSNGIAMTRAQVVDSLARAPQWDGYSITDAMIVEMSATVVALTYTGTGRREHGEDFTGLMVTTYVKSGQQWRIGFYQQTPST